MDYKKIYETAYLVGIQEDWDDDHTEVSCPVYDLWVDDGHPDRHIYFSGAMYEDYELIEGELGSNLGYSLIQAGLVADNRITYDNFEAIFNSGVEAVVTVNEEGNIAPTSAGEGIFTPEQAILTGLLLIEKFGE